MSNLLKKITISFLAFLVIFTSISPNILLVKAQSPVRCGTEGEACCNLAGSAPNSCGTGLECTNGRCTAIPGETNVAQRGTVTNQSQSSAPAEGTWYNQGFGQWYNKVYDENTSPGNEIFGERYTAAQVQWVVYSLFAFILNGSMGNSSTSQKAVTCLLTGSANIENCAAPLQELLQLGQASNSTLAQDQKKNLFQIVTADRPFSGISYVRGKINKFKLVPEAQAAGPGFGFDALKPVQDMWRASRNIAFGLFVITAIVFAFMIMFRVKISPQVVISIQSAIPQMIVALIFVTFSYAIAGFLIDFMYIFIGIVSYMLAPFIPVVAFLGLQPHQYTAPDVFNLLVSGEAPGFLNAIGGIFNLILIYLTPLLVTIFIICVILLFAGGPAVIIGLAIFVIAILLAIWFSLKILWALLKAFANILLLTIFAPIQLALGPLIPGLGISQWIKSYLSHLSVFVVTGVLWLFAWIFGLLAWRGLSSFSLAGATPTNDSWPPLLGSSEFGTTLIYIGASFVCFTLIPKATEIVQGFISKRPFAYGTAIGEALGPFTAAGGFGADIAKSFGRDFATGFIRPGARGRGLRRGVQQRAEREVLPGEGPSPDA